MKRSAEGAERGIWPPRNSSRTALSDFKLHWSESKLHWGDFELHRVFGKKLMLLCRAFKRQSES